VRVIINKKALVSSSGYQQST